MSLHSIDPESKSLSLRRIAEARLREGTAPPTRTSPLDQDALSQLYAMASNPERSSDALRLLQELQVHQVELDLQREELENHERETSRDLARYKALFELTPTACMVATMEGRIIEANPAAGSLFNTGHSELLGRTLHDFLKLESPASWNELLRELGAGERTAACEVRVGTGNGEAVTLRLSASAPTEGDVMLLAVASREPVSHAFGKHPQSQ